VLTSIASFPVRNDYSFNQKILVDTRIMKTRKMCDCAFWKPLKPAASYPRANSRSIAAVNSSLAIELTTG